MDVFEEDILKFFQILNKHKTLIEEKERSSRAKDKEDAEQLKKLYKKL